MESISCIIVDDDKIDRLTTQSFLQDYSFINIAGIFDNATDALQFASDKTPDVLFLDIDMPVMSGLKLREKLMRVPACIFVTSYPDYATESFEVNALDFLVKPFSHERFAKSIARVEQYIRTVRKADLLSHTLGADTVLIKEGYTEIKLQLHEVCYLEAMKDYTGIVTKSRKYMVLSPLGTLIKQTPFDKFIRIHKSYAVPKGLIKQKNSTAIILHDDTELPIGRAYKEALNFSL